MGAKESLLAPKPLAQRLIEGVPLMACGIILMGTALLTLLLTLYVLIRIVQDPSNLPIQIPGLLLLSGTAVYALATIRHEIRCPRPSWTLLESDDMARYLPASRNRWSRADDTSSN